MGYIMAHFGVQGWLKVFSHTRPREEILNYPVWIIDGREYPVEKKRVSNKNVLVKLSDLDTREETEHLIRKEIAIDRSSLSQTQPGEYYWADLIGMRVESLDGARLGEITQLHETGANDVIEISNTVGDNHLIPWADTYICSVDLVQRIVIVDWTFTEE